MRGRAGLHRSRVTRDTFCALKCHKTFPETSRPFHPPPAPRPCTSTHAHLAPHPITTLLPGHSNSRRPQEHPEVPAEEPLKSLAEGRAFRAGPPRVWHSAVGISGLWRPYRHSAPPAQRAWPCRRYPPAPSW